MNYGKVSVIVPVYNLENLVTRTIQSIQNQEYKNLEIILVDDGSDDNTLKIISKLQDTDSRIKVYHQVNSGVTVARLNGVRHSTGEWIGFVDGDDLIAPDMYARLVENAIRYGADISHCGYQMVFSDHTDYYYNTSRVIRQTNRAGIIDLLSGEYIEPGLWNKLYKRSLFDELIHTEKMDVSIKNMEDLLMNFYLFRQAEISIYEDFCPYYYIPRKGSAANSNLNEHILQDPGKVYKHIEEELINDRELFLVIHRRTIGEMVNVATRSYKGQKTFVRLYQAKARKWLHREAKNIFSYPYPIKKKILFLWAAVSPNSYKIVHILYGKVSGSSKKYRID